MSFSIAFQAASMQKRKTSISSHTRKMPHSKTYVAPKLQTHSPQPDINEIGETEENVSDFEEEQESTNTFVFDMEHSIKESEFLAPQTKDFATQNLDYENLDNWNFDVIAVNSVMDKYRLIGTMFQSLGYIERFEIELAVFGRFLHQLQEKYNVRNNPFHNFDHGFTGFEFLLLSG